MSDPIARIVAEQIGEDESDAGEQLELLPIVMVYFTVKIDHARGWTNSVRVQTPDGKTCLQAWGRAGASLPHGITKCTSDLETAYRMAARMGPFD